ncbi:polysaccharide biosynthesis protein [Pandoraea iniqua]|uniref:Polysaccharide biosynthesis protein n=1 Tax=Pandoraea iniqua TaxID=2508288 RepID=A0A5E4Z077_9BURK|nr:flippase [Pandoraea iniqua]VVD60461.1 polysaccharide biosynthesis protein [Pandoraea iniqua]VVE54519.1 polysaccharide biosynthesis protein [Pandoraea iniqua]
MSIKRNSLWNLAGLGGPLLVAAVTVPYLLRHLGVESFGILTLIWTLIGYFSLFDLGLGRAITQKVSSILNSNRKNEVNPMIQSGLVVTAAAGLFGMLVLAALAHVLAHKWLNVSGTLIDETFWSLIISAIGIPITTLTIGFRGVLEAFENFKISSTFRIILGILNFAAPAVVVACVGNSLVWISLSLIVTRLLVAAIHWRYVSRVYDIKFARSGVSWAYVKELIAFGGWTTASNVIGPLLVSADRFFISSVLGATAVAYYTVPYEIANRMLIIPVALTGALFPRLSNAIGSQHHEAETTYKNSWKLILYIMLPICLAAAALSKVLLTIWLGAKFAEQSWMAASILFMGIFFNSLASVPFTYIQAAGKSRTTAFIHIFETIVYIPALLLVLHTVGIVGAAIAWSGRALFDLLILLYLRRELSVTARGGEHAKSSDAKQ